MPDEDSVFFFFAAKMGILSTFFEKNLGEPPPWDLVQFFFSKKPPKMPIFGQKKNRFSSPKNGVSQPVRSSVLIPIIALRTILVVTSSIWDTLDCTDIFFLLLLSEFQGSSLLNPYIWIDGLWIQLGRWLKSITSSSYDMNQLVVTQVLT